MNQDALLEEAFNLYDKEGKGYIETKLLGVVLRSVGKIPTQAEVREFSRFYTEKHGGKVNLNMLKEIAKKVNRTVTKEQIMSAYKVFDREGRGYILVKEFRHILTTVGEKLSDNDVTTMLKQAQIGEDGKINFQQFTKIMRGNTQ